MPWALEITNFHNLLEQNVWGNRNLLNEYKSRILIRADDSLPPFARDWKIKIRPTALANSTSAHLFPFINFGEKKGKESKI